MGETPFLAKTSWPWRLSKMSGSSAWSPSRVRWSLRKLKLPIRRSDRVLEIGSGGNPHPAADVLVDKYLSSGHRYSPMVADRPAILADACALPFADKSFDYVIAFHVLEHIPDPVAFAKELSRVGRAGYIETPNAIFERLVPYQVHVLEIMQREGVLTVNRKPAPRHDPILSESRLVESDPAWRALFYGRPELFHVQFHWRDRIPVKMLNEDESALGFTYDDRSDPELPPERSTHASDLRSFGLKAARLFWRYRKRSDWKLNDLLVCPRCRHRLDFLDQFARCKDCAQSFQLAPLPDFRLDAEGR